MRKKPLVRLLLSILMMALPAISSAAIIFSIGFAPPPLPIYEQPVCPGDGYIWTPGYWAYDDVDGYFWVPGTWVLIPEPGLLWTPGYWGWDGGFFVFHEGYWGPHVGFYGGINYGFGYVGVGYEGGYWDHDRFFYNRSVNHIDYVTNVYNKTVVVNNTYVSYNGGAGGITARPTAQEEAAMRDRHIPPSAVQVQHRQTASTNRQLFESVNHGKPAIAATPRPAEFSGHGVVAAKAAARNYAPPTARGGAAPARVPEAGRGNAPEPTRGNATERSAPAVHANQLPPLNRPTYPGGNSKAEKQYQQQQEKLYNKQQQERQKLEQQQEQEHQKLARSNPTPQRQQQLEQKHQQQTQQMQQRHAAEQQRMQTRAPQPAPERRR